MAVTHLRPSRRASERRETTVASSDEVIRATQEYEVHGSGKLTSGCASGGDAVVPKAYVKGTGMVGYA